MEGGSEIEFDSLGASPKCVEFDLNTHPAPGDSCIPYLRYFPTTFPPGHPPELMKHWRSCARAPEGSGGPPHHGGANPPLPAREETPPQRREAEPGRRLGRAPQPWARVGLWRVPRVAGQPPGQNWRRWQPREVRSCTDGVGSCIDGAGSCNDGVGRRIDGGQLNRRIAQQHWCIRQLYRLLRSKQLHRRSGHCTGTPGS